MKVKRAGNRNRETGAILTESVILKVLVVLMLVSVLWLFSLAFKRTTCDNVFGVELKPGEELNPWNIETRWRTNAPQGEGCYYTPVEDPIRIY